MEQQLTQTITVDENQTAENLGSGLLPVFSTPALVAFMENTAMKLISTPEGKSSVGTAISVKHLKASAVGEQITCTATLIENEGRRYVFALTATDSKGNLIGEGTHERFVIDIEKFMSKL
ncbi:MAG: Thioesterase superfamily [Bacteroidetes bacterium]|jgi:predicted thioesterase|nr:Thioesterase superfamily [Bacteroidota bacterium]